MTEAWRADEAEGAGLDSLLRVADHLDFDDFFHTSWRRLYPMAVGIAGDRASAEDALQTAFAKAYASWSRVSAAHHPEAYVRRMVVNEIISSRRSAWFRRERSTAEPDAGAASASPEGAVVDRDAVWAAVQGLPVRQRAVIVLRYYEDLSEAEIADVLGCSRGTVKSQASAALRNLRTDSFSALTGEGAPR
ncbi:SigE family RNA polymerase sigma factor [Nocardioides KLBMP 9356]|uniref:SigE family RNA polymerase sigma factor n=1 Tax=Nocardioides potassii TaxID=2911371 RepID=A0ABS9H8B3_9ACTN|nr:SigE family RNA polymerase sigma factor [Nocardioides potassii]MCF6377452.1 SigE family RNA polymerase sigma factor [Nocardioides potassii]